jgi:hypothetical protein
MKKLILPIAAIALLSFASCKKDHTCTCTDSSDAPGYVAGDPQITTYTEAKKADARAACMSYSVVSNNYTYTTTCELK